MFAARQQHCNRCETTLQPPSQPHCNNIASQQLYCNGTATVLQHHCNSHFNSTETALQQTSNNFAIALQQLCNSNTTETVLQQTNNSNCCISLHSHSSVEA